MKNERGLRIPPPNTKTTIRAGIEGFADGMRIFPRLTEQESQIALAFLRAGSTVDALRIVPPFKQKLSEEREKEANRTGSPYGSYTSLFQLSPSIDLLVSLGNFHTIRTWTWTLARQHPDLNLPLEQFFQTALYKIVPAQARSYDPAFERSFTSYVVSMLKKRFSNFVSWHTREHTTTTGYEDTSTERRGRPAASKQRRWFVSMDAPMPIDPTHTYLEYLEANTQAPEDTTRQDDLTARSRVHILSQLAGLTTIQEETLIALFVYGGNTRLLANLRGCTSRSVRMHRQIAEEKIHQLGYELVSDVLTGRYETLEEARASMLETSIHHPLDEVMQAG